ncbi:hypothetical protein BVRB_6g154140 [Beta vulgaris subsp. vulgaris]|nr:hypothetical protein BVRB_6g154140 [Beta vulgaris subsp. vulgaris]
MDSDNFFKCVVIVVTRPEYSFSPYLWRTMFSSKLRPLAL